MVKILTLHFVHVNWPVKTSVLQEILATLDIVNKQLIIFAILGINTKCYPYSVLTLILCYHFQFKINLRGHPCKFDILKGLWHDRLSAWTYSIERSQMINMQLCTIKLHLIQKGLNPIRLIKCKNSWLISIHMNTTVYIHFVIIYGHYFIDWSC